MIRLTTYEDINYVQQIAIETWQDTYKNIIPQDIQLQFLDESYSDRMLQKRIEKSIMLIAESKGEPVGFANFTQVDEDGDAELIAMYILPAYQQKGLGQKLFQAAINEMSDAQQIFVYVNNQNGGGKNFCEKLGFQLLNTFDETFMSHPVETVEYIFRLK